MIARKDFNFLVSLQRTNIFPALNKSALVTPKRKFVETPVVQADDAPPPSSKRMRMMASSPLEEESEAVKECLAKLDQFCQKVGGQNIIVF